MKALKVLGIIVLFLIALFFIVPYFLTDNIVVSHSEVINAKPATIFRQVNNFHNWSNWSPFEADQTMENTYEGPEQGVGAIRTWSGEEAGEGLMEIEKSEPYEYIQTKLVFGPDGGGGTGSWNFDETPEGTEVIWTVHIKDLSYPLNRWFGLVVEPGLEPMLVKGLDKLKEITEAIPQPPEIKVVMTEAVPSLIIYDSTTMSGMGEMMGKNFGDLYEYVMRRKIPITGQQFAIYHNWNPKGITRISTGIPVAENSRAYKNIEYYVLPAGNAIFAQHKGGYNTSVTHEAIDDYIKDFNLETKDYIWESYLYNPMTDTDSTQWVTFIYYPL